MAVFHDNPAFSIDDDKNIIHFFIKTGAGRQAIFFRVNSFHGLLVKQR